MTGILNSSARMFIILLFIASILPLEESMAKYSLQWDAAASEAIRLSELEHQGDAAGLYRTLHPDAKEIISQKTIKGWYENEFFPLEPQPISEVISVRYVTWTWEVTGKQYDQTAEIEFVQPFGTGGNQYLVTETVRLVSTGNDEWSWFFGRSHDFVAEQQALYDPDPVRSESSTSTVTRTNRNSNSRSDRDSSNNSRKSRSNSASSSKHPESSASCTLVELAPGYPGYRGLVTGLSQNYGGLADWECLETLNKDYPGFDRKEEDRLNREAAEALGISGGPTDWVWENWMAIEAFRGLPTNCYTCLMLDENTIPINTRIEQDWRDPRIQTGFFGSTSAISMYLPTAMQRNNFVDNYQLRAHAFFVMGPQANANDILHVYEKLGHDEYWVGFDFSYILSVGGYTWVTERAHMNDQIFSVKIAYVSITYLHPSHVRNAIYSQVEQNILNWQTEILHGSDESLVNYLKRNLRI